MNAIATTERPIETHAGSHFIWHATAEETGGAFFLAETVVPAGAEPPLHIHTREDEMFYVIDGEVTFQRGLERIDAQPGDAVLLPRGIPHGFAVRTPNAQMLLLATPGTLEGAFRASSVPVEDAVPGAPSEDEVARIVAAFAAHGVQMTGPPLPILLAQEA